jgi:hypothetical protein
VCNRKHVSDFPAINIIHVTKPFKPAQAFLLNCKDIYFERVRQAENENVALTVYLIFLIYFADGFYFYYFTGNN